MVLKRRHRQHDLSADRLSPPTRMQLRIRHKLRAAASLMPGGRSSRHRQPPTARGVRRPQRRPQRRPPDPLPSNAFRPSARRHLPTPGRSRRRARGDARLQRRRSGRHPFRAGYAIIRISTVSPRHFAKTLIIPASTPATAMFEACSTGVRLLGPGVRQSRGGRFADGPRPAGRQMNTSLPRPITVNLPTRPAGGRPTVPLDPKQTASSPQLPDRLGRQHF